VIGLDKDADGKGEPVLVNKKPNIGKQYPRSTVQDSDELNGVKFGLQWQWQANPKEGWAFPTPNGSLRMFSVYQPDSIRSAWNYPNILAQKFPAEEFSVTVKISFKPKFENERFSLVVFGADYASLSIIKKNDGVYIVQSENINADKSKNEIVISSMLVSGNEFYLKVKVSKRGICDFSYESEKGSGQLLKTFTAKPGRWVGAKIGLFCTRTNITNDAGFADIDWIHFDK
jgi:hypothetical protein